MTQALYAHMNNKTIKILKKEKRCTVPINLYKKEDIGLKLSFFYFFDVSLHGFAIREIMAS
jgi:hypothetical protein